ncbi:MAG: ATP-binding cassette domain-containing protein [Dehalococcoidia bacterium]
MPTALEVHALNKRFGDRTVVDDVTFSVDRGEVFGLLGPNGSGKTTTIRMALDIVRPDSGSVVLLGGAATRQVIRRVGYLPEERGLLRKVKVLNILRYLGRLKGMSSAEATERGAELLHRVGLYEHRDKRVETLSRGMTQLVQFCASLIHEPELIILDEPFSGLDPLNVQLMKEIVRDQQERGATVIFSTHIMSDVEELCERVVLIADGRLLLFGNLNEIRRGRGANGVRVHAGNVPPGLDGKTRYTGRDGVFEFPLEDSVTPESVLQGYLDAGIAIERFELMLPSLNEIFIEEVSRARQP